MIGDRLGDFVDQLERQIVPHAGNGLQLRALDVRGA